MIAGGVRRWPRAAAGRTGPVSRHPGGTRGPRESRAVLRRLRDADAGRGVGPAEADAVGGAAAVDLACDALIRPFRAHRFRAVPGARGTAHQGLLPDLLRD